MKKLYRDTKKGKIGGVCSGLAEYFNIDVLVIEIIFILGLIQGIALIPYLIMWVVIPEKPTI